MADNKKLLLSSVCRPLGPEYGDALSVGYELLHGQITRAQGIFSPRCFTHHFSLDYIAHNVDAPTVVLQYPSEEEFIRELKKGYDFIGLSFVPSTFHHAKRMSALIRKYSPNSKIILGGYGTIVKDEELLPYGDFICREEGVAFLRNVLGESPKPFPYDHPLIVNGLTIFSIPTGMNGMIFGGLGCPNGCDFCCTSHFFKRKHIRLLPEGDDIFHLVERYRREYPRIKFTVLDEDFLLNQKRARRFLELVRVSGKEPPSMFVFASVKALSMYETKELLEMGVNGVWIGYEGKRSGYAKQEGRNVPEMFGELRKAGITVLASMIIGFDYQTSEIVREELNELLDLKPTFAQFLIYGPTPGTPFYSRIEREGALLPEYREDPEHYYHDCTGFYGLVRHPHFSNGELQKLQEECFRTDFTTLGPSIIRAIHNWFLGYQNLRSEPNPLLVKRAETYRQDILESLPIFFASKIFAPSEAARRYVVEVERQIKGELKTNPVLLALKSGFAFLMACWTALCLRMNWFQHPHLVRTAYRLKAKD